MSRDQSNIRNFCIVAHIDHGKSTLADRIMDVTGAVSKREAKQQLLDSMDIERERGITIKLTPVRMDYEKDGKKYVFNLIDTPGHVDFTYEVSRSLKACEGAILIVDASQGVEAQTLTNVYLAVDNDLEIIPVINKIDLPSARPDEVKTEIEDVIGIPADDAPLISAKEGVGIEEVLAQVVDRLPPPSGDADKPLKALVFDSYYDSYKGAVSIVRIFDGSVSAGDKIVMMSTGMQFDVTEVGFFTPGMRAVDTLEAGDVGYLCASIKNVSDTKVGDTITSAVNPTAEPLSGFKEAEPMVYSGVYPADGAHYDDLKDALEKLKLNDAALFYEPEVSAALGFGFRCGFLGLLHMEIIEERLEREFNLDLVTTAPSVSYRVVTTSGEVVEVSNPTMLPPVGQIDHMEEPVVKAEIFTPPEYVGTVMELCQDKRGTFVNMTYIEAKRVMLEYEMPLNEIIYDFFDSLKSRSKGYASLDYEILGYKRGDLVKMDILLNGELCDALSLIIHKDKAYARGRVIAEKLKDIIPRQLFEVPIQAAIGGKVIARETVKAVRKDVLAKCYGGDITRKKKLLEKQKEGKKKMRTLGTVQLPSEAFMAVLKLDEE